MLKNQNGITLVALVVTIIVLIILATISISVAVNGGIIGKAEQAADWQANADKTFDEQSANVTKYIDDYIANVTTR